ncbi:MAG TPA: hypothetical protein VFI23_10410 [Rhizomicrobium sp.]|nr:hypothetical protein [Rhizomicrobium sp.]
MRIIRGGKERSYVVGAMFTAAYSDKAERLAASCDRLGLPYMIYEVPTVHQSVSARGSDDLSYTKPNIIRRLLAECNKPVLYLDVDCEIMSEPTLIDDFARTGCDFAIYNWCADEHTDCFIPVALSPGENQPPVRNRFYRFEGSVDLFSKRQMVCNGLVQFYGNSIAGRALLSRWHRTIAAFPGCTDDGALAFTFNNLTRLSWLSWVLKVRWLPKSYARIAWWIYAKPVINHADLPSKSTRTAIKDPRGRKQYYGSLMEHRTPTALFPRDCIIDTEQSMLYRLVEGQLVSIGPANQTFWR